MAALSYIGQACITDHTYKSNHFTIIRRASIVLGYFFDAVVLLLIINNK